MKGSTERLTQIDESSCLASMVYSLTHHFALVFNTVSMTESSSRKGIAETNFFYQESKGDKNQLYCFIFF